MRELTPSQSQRIIHWSLCGESGLSSTAMMLVFLGLNEPGEYLDYPRDPGDLKRCIKLLDAFPEFKQDLPKIASISPQWKIVVENWDRLEVMLRAEAPEWFWRINPTQQSASRTLLEMKKLGL